jgi:hypothetical protein
VIEPPGKKNLILITMTPATVINGEKVAVGQVLEIEALKRRIDRIIDGYNH